MLRMWDKRQRGYRAMGYRIEAEAEASHCPASQVMRELMREFIARQRQAREYDAFLRAKVDTARSQIASGQVASSADVEARFAARRAALRAKAGGRDRFRVPAA